MGTEIVPYNSPPLTRRMALWRCWRPYAEASVESVKGRIPRWQRILHRFCMQGALLLMHYPLVTFGRRRLWFISGSGRGKSGGGPQQLRFGAWGVCPSDAKSNDECYRGFMGFLSSPKNKADEAATVEEIAGPLKCIFIAAVVLPFASVVMSVLVTWRMGMPSRRSELKWKGRRSDHNDWDKWDFNPQLSVPAMLCPTFTALGMILIGSVAFFFFEKPNISPVTLYMYILLFLLFTGWAILDLRLCQRLSAFENDSLRKVTKKELEEKGYHV